MTKHVDYNNHGFEDINIKSQRSLEMLGEALGTQIIRTHEFTHGCLNKVFLAEKEDDKQVIKISPLWNPHGLAREKWAYGKMKGSSKLRLAQILLYLDINNSIFPGHEILALEHIEGHQITHTEMLMTETHKKIARILGEFHGIKNIKGYGWLQPDFSGEHENWLSFLTEIDNIKTVISSNLIHESEIEWILKELSSNTSQNPETSMLYGDLKKTNLIVEEHEQIVPIDLQNCFVGDPTYDVGIGIFFNPEIQQNIHEYLPDKALQKLAILYALRHALSVLGHRISTNNQNGIQQALRRFKDLKKTYKSL